MDVKTILIGNKIDLLEDRMVTVQEGEDWAKSKGFYFMEVSAKTNENLCVNGAIEELCE